MQKLQKNRMFAASIAGVMALFAISLTATALEHHEKEMTAEIVEVDVQTNTITLKPMDAEIDETSMHEEYTAKDGEKADMPDELTVVVDEETRITNDGDLISLAALEPGERVNVRYTEAEDDRIKILGIVIFTTS